ncbi:hypothetical protein L1049_015793 [Liquidambar formosana]|uniref:LSM-interacting domain-containing protein n=1 Tax=Liquidambar formosana TaxID=63359 RepID=A0AAP0S5F7_LIQFO
MHRSGFTCRSLLPERHSGCVGDDNDVAAADTGGDRKEGEGKGFIFRKQRSCEDENGLHHWKNLAWVWCGSLLPRKMAFTGIMDAVDDDLISGTVIPHKQNLVRFESLVRELQGLAYVDFSDDAHLAAAVAKNRQMLLGKKLSIARSNPKQRRKNESTGQSVPVEHGKAVDHGSEQTNTVGSDSCESVGISKESTAPQAPSSAIRRHGDDNVQLKGKNTFALPRTIARPLGWTKNKPEPEEGVDEKPKSNDEFRKMFLKG